MEPANPHTGLPGTSSGAPSAHLPAWRVADPTLEADARYPRTTNRPATGLPDSVRLPAELPDNLWPPPGLLESAPVANVAAPEVLLPAVAAAPAPVDDTATRESPAVPSESGDAFLRTVMASAETEKAGPSPRVRRRRRGVAVAYVVVVTALVLVGAHLLQQRSRTVDPVRDAVPAVAEPEQREPEQKEPEQKEPEQNEPDQKELEPTEPAEKQTPTAEPETQGKAGDFRYAKTRGPVLGTGGRLHRFRVAVEETLAEPAPREFADALDLILGDDRSWVSDGRLRMRRVATAAGADFTVYLASARTSEVMCATGGLETEGFTSCRLPGQVIINADRWAGGIPDYEGELEKYRRYAVNHEVGHELGHGHETCPGRGEPAPVMMPQTYGLRGCVPNEWPYLDGERYSGEPAS
ncbi:DUF3152 domain-containing protein [Actinoplanes rectilineatus]|uniref:DUF3152 domain-containing protein n=1 Tax=Actinoplanes rectilineatus TaxID=113571 RepID=UPI0006987B85|nr:DUF3152 domain-containing protein [Actinoplanes rectilineatus]